MSAPRRGRGREPAPLSAATRALTSPGTPHLTQAPLSANWNLEPHGEGPVLAGHGGGSTDHPQPGPEGSPAARFRKLNGGRGRSPLRMWVRCNPLFSKSLNPPLAAPNIPKARAPRFRLSESGHLKGLTRSPSSEVPAPRLLGLPTMPHRVRLLPVGPVLWGLGFGLFAVLSLPHACPLRRCWQLSPAAVPSHSVSSLVFTPVSPVSGIQEDTSKPMCSPCSTERL